jgi:WD40-like Beta Propeller Repeat
MMMRQTVWFVFGVMLLVAMNGCTRGKGRPPVPPPKPSAATVVEERLGKYGGPPGLYPVYPKLSANGQHIAWIVRRWRGWQVALDESRGPAFDEIGGIENHHMDHGWDVCAEFGDDGGHVAYRGRQGRRWYVVVDGRVGAAYDEVRVESGRFFGDRGGGFAYAARNGATWHMVHNGQPGPDYDQVSWPALSPDGTRVAYVATVKGQGQLVVLDSRAIGQAEKIDEYSLTFSPNGKRFAYATEKPQAAVAVDGAVWRLKHEVVFSDLLFSPDSKHIAYVDGSTTHDADKCAVVVDGKPGRTYDEVGKPGFTLRGEVCYAARRGNGEVVVVADRESPVYDSVYPMPFWAASHGMWPGPAPVFSPDGKHSAYGACRGGKGSVVLDGREGSRFLDVREPVFGPDGRSVAYGGEVGREQWVVVLDGRPGAAYHNFGRLTFSPNGKRLAYMACLPYKGNRKQAAVVVDGQRGLVWDSVWPPSFSADSRHVAYVATQGSHQRVVVDGREGPWFDEVFANVADPTCELGVHFNADGAAEYIGRRADIVYRVRQKAAGG